MATLCKNCGHALIFDPASQMMQCAACGSNYLPEEVESEIKAYREDLNAESLNDVYGTDDEKYYDTYIYTCSECGGEIIINGTEASTNCIYCGNSNVVFSRIAKEKCPQYVLPFSITKDEAVRLVRERVSKGIFIPKEIKEFEAENVRGIYIPYWIVDAEFKDAVTIKGQVKSGKHTRTVYCVRAGKLDLNLFPIDGSKALSDESSSKLEPFDLKDLKPFDEDYLMGFYSNVSDVTFGDIREAAFIRAKEYFETQALEDVKASDKKIISSNPSMNLKPEMYYAMLPAWFVTFKYKGKQNTILINGTTGKVVCGLPWRKALFCALLIIVGIAVTIAAFFIFKNTLPILLGAGRRRSSSSSNSEGKLLGALIAGIVALFSTGIHRMKKVIRQINLTQAKGIFNFVKQRQD